MSQLYETMLKWTNYIPICTITLCRIFIQSFDDFKGYSKILKIKKMQFLPLRVVQVNKYVAANSNYGITEICCILKAYQNHNIIWIYRGLFSADNLQVWGVLKGFCWMQLLMSPLKNMLCQPFYESSSPKKFYGSNAHTIAIYFFGKNPSHIFRTQ